MYYNHFLSTKRLMLGLTCIILTYFIYHIYHGERGLIAQESLEKEYAELKKTYDILHQEKLKLRNKIDSLGGGDGQIDPDLLDEEAKKQGYIAPNETMITY